MKRTIVLPEGPPVIIVCAPQVPVPNIYGVSEVAENSESTPRALSKDLVFLMNEEAKVGREPLHLNDCRELHREQRLELLKM